MAESFTVKTVKVNATDRQRLKIVRKKMECPSDSEAFRKALKLAVEKLGVELEAR